MHGLDLAALGTLDALLQEGSVQGAARRLGLSAPAVSHALARLRVRLEDPLLTRAGRGMVLTPRAEALRPQVHEVVAQARRLLTPERPFSAPDLEQTFVLVATDYVVAVLGLALDQSLREVAPRAGLRFLPNTSDDARLLREGEADLAIGIYGALPPELRTRPLLTDRFVVVVREGHPLLRRRFDLDAFLAHPHVQVAPRGRPGGYLDDVLGALGRRRRVARAFPYFLPALHLVAHTDYLLTISERIARLLGPALGLRILEPPLRLAPYALSMLWHPRFDADPAHRLLRTRLLGAARASAGELHQGARTRLDPSRSPRARSRK